MEKEKGRECLVRVISRQTDVQGEQQVIKTECRGQLTGREGVLYVLYKENMDETQVKAGEHMTVKNLLRIIKEPAAVSLKKTGAVSFSMTYAEGKRDQSEYRTPYGSLEISVETTAVNIRSEQKKTSLQLMYTLFIQGEKQADCRLDIEII